MSQHYKVYAGRIRTAGLVVRIPPVAREKYKMQFKETECSSVYLTQPSQDRVPIGDLWTWWWIFTFYKRRDISWIVQQLSASHEGLCFIQLHWICYSRRLLYHDSSKCVGLYLNMKLPGPNELGAHGLGTNQLPANCWKALPDWMTSDTLYEYILK